jgi:hypothetical protein
MSIVSSWNGKIADAVAGTRLAELQQSPKL